MNWFDLPRETRAVNAARILIERLGTLLDNSDAQDYAKAEAAREAKLKGKKGGK